MSSDSDTAKNHRYRIFATNRPTGVRRHLTTVWAESEGDALRQGEGFGQLMADRYGRHSSDYGEYEVVEVGGE